MAKIRKKFQKNITVTAQRERERTIYTSSNYFSQPSTLFLYLTAARSFCAKEAQGAVWSVVSEIKTGAQQLIDRKSIPFFIENILTVQTCFRLHEYPLFKA